MCIVYYVTQWILSYLWGFRVLILSGVFVSTSSTLTSDACLIANPRDSYQKWIWFEDESFGLVLHTPLPN